MFKHLEKIFEKKYKQFHKIFQGQKVILYLKKKLFFSNNELVYIFTL